MTFEFYLSKVHLHKVTMTNELKSNLIYRPKIRKNRRYFRPRRRMSHSESNRVHFICLHRNLGAVMCFSKENVAYSMKMLLFIQNLFGAV